MSQPVNEEVFVPTGWGQVKPRTVLDLPSGSKVLIRELEIQDLLSLGILDIVDQFSQEILPKASVKGKSVEKKFLQDVAENSDQFEKMVDVMNKITASAVIKPSVTYAPLPENGQREDLDPNKVYAHLVPLEDRLQIFEKAVAGMEDLFRSGEGQTEGVAAVADEQSVPDNASPAYRDIEPRPGLLSE